MDEQQAPKMTLIGFSVGQVSWEVDPKEHAAAVSAGCVSDEYDCRLSDMSEETVILVPDHDDVIWPYGGNGHLIDLIKPILEHVPTWQVEQYAVKRRMDEE